MPRTRSLAWAELKIGLLTIFAVIMATVLIFLLSGEGGFFWQRYTIKTVFPNIAGLKPGAPQRLKFRYYFETFGEFTVPRASS